MDMTSVLLSLFVLALHPVSRTAYSQLENTQCSRQDYDFCVKMADPLLKDPHLIFPDNKADIDLVCRKWSQFVDCVKRYTDRCFTESRRQEFNKAVESPVDSVHQMCTVTKYQTEYLRHATCIKSTLIREDHCGRHYQHLVDQVFGEANRISLCCSHLRFRQCVLEETKRQCDSGSNGGSAARFSRQMLDKALSFLRDQCYNYIPTTGECPGISYTGHDESMSNSNIVPDQQHRSSNHQPFSPDVNPHKWNPQATGDRRGTSSSVSPWMPGNSTGYQTTLSRNNWTSGGELGGSNTPTYDSIQPNKDDDKSSWLPGGQSSDSGISRSSYNPPDMTTSTHSSRSPSYGRGITWTPSSNTQMSNSDFTSNTWHITSNSQHTTEPWYPGVSNYGGSYSGNAVDEPNQQGLSNNNSAVTVWFSYVILAIFTLIHIVV